MPDQTIVNEVQRLRSQNLSNDDIVQRLLYQGYSNADVFDAISQADVNPVAYEEPSHATPMQYAQHQTETIDTSKISEIAESIIEEKWSDLVDHVNRVIEWKSSVELKIASMEEQMKGLRSDFDTLHKAILGKIGDNESVMREVSTDVKALEEVFKKILPGFVENVNELSRITQTMKKR